MDRRSLFSYRSPPRLRTCVTSKGGHLPETPSSVAFGTPTEQKLPGDTGQFAFSCPTIAEPRIPTRGIRRRKPCRQPRSNGQDAAVRLLFVNHDRLFRKFALRSLKRPDFDVCATGTADAGLSAILRAHKTKYHMMILNLELPDIRPREMILRCRLASPHLPVLLVGRCGRDDLEHACRAADADRCLCIPCGAKDLRAAVFATLR